LNIFFIDQNPKTAANQLCDQHKYKMILESAQLLSNAYHFAGEGHKVENIYKPAYLKHPSTKWVRCSIQNFAWLALHLATLVDRYDAEGGSKERYVRVRQILNSMVKDEPPTLANIGLLPPFLAFGSEDKELNTRCKELQAQYGTFNEGLGVWESVSWENGVSAYRAYYCLKQFKNNKRPTWSSKVSCPVWYVPTN
jgi:hypothetical protein